jgi:hypothetical protein
VFEVSEEASEKIRQFLEGRATSGHRVLMTAGGGPYLVMALDGYEDDEVFTKTGDMLSKKHFLKG